MKKLLALLILPLTVIAAEPVITINDNDDVLVDGQNYGKPGDVMANNRQLIVPVQKALNKARRERAEARDKERTDLDEAQRQVLAEFKAAREKDREELKASVDTQLADVRKRAETEIEKARLEVVDAKAKQTAAEQRAAVAEGKLAALLKPLRELRMEAYPLDVRAAIVAAIANDKEKKRAALAAHKAMVEAEMAKLDVPDSK